MECTYTFGLNGYTLLVLALEKVPEEADSEVERRSKHTIPGQQPIQNEYMRIEHGHENGTYCDSVRKMGIVLVSVKF